MLIDTDNYAASGFEVIFFSGGEPHVVAPPIAEKHAHIYAKLRTPNDVLGFLAVCNALEYQGVKRHVFMPYAPGARQDRVQLRGAFTAQVYAQLFEHAVSTLTVCDIHSEAAYMEYRGIIGSTRMRELSIETIIRSLVAETETTYDAIICPDAGARNRTADVADILDVRKMLECSKRRDPATGQIDIKVPEDGSIEDLKSVLIPDDICDGGATFVMIAEKLHEINPTLEIDLYVTHGIFSKGFWVFNAGFRNIMTTDSFFRADQLSDLPDNLELYSLNLIQHYLESLTP